jgi:lysophospholipase
MVDFLASFGLGRTCLPNTRSLGEDDFESNRLTSDMGRFEKMQKLLRQTPELMVSTVTFQWLKAAFQSIELLASPGFAEGIDTPVLLFSAQDDEIVCNQSQHAICSKLQNCKMVSIPCARHELLQETDTVQIMFWESFDQWIKYV